VLNEANQQRKLTVHTHLAAAQEDEEQSKKKLENTTTGSEAWWTGGTKHDKCKAKISMKAEGDNYIELDDNHISEQKHDSTTGKDLMKATRGARRERVGKGKKEE